MQNISKLSIQKVLATVLIALLVLANAMPSLSYAADVAQDVKTSEENVEFSAVFEKVQDSKTTQESTENVANEKQSEEAKTESASINSFAKNLTATVSNGADSELHTSATSAKEESANSEGSKETANQTEESAPVAESTEAPELTADFKEKVNLKLTIKVLNTGYLKDGEITIAQNNYAIPSIESEYVKEVNGSTLVLNQINAGTEAVITLPITLPKTEDVPAYVFANTSKLTLKATYVNEKGKDRKIEKTQELKLNWTNNDAKASVSQAIVRNLKYDDKTMLTFEVAEGIVDNSIPAREKEISITVPQINKQNPSKVIFSKEGYTSDYKDGTLTITSKNEADKEGNIKWNSQDSFLVTYIYDAQSDEKQVTTNAHAKITSYDGKVLEADAENATFDVSSELGSIVELAASTDDSISKGYMYTNLDTDSKKETAYTEKLSVDFGSSDLTDKVTVEEKETSLPTSVNSISVDGSQVSKILGDAGTITVFNAATNEELGKLTKDATSLDLTGKETKPVKVRLETSKPNAEGQLDITVSKVINSDIGLNKDQITNTNKMQTSINIKGIKGETEISNKDVVAESNLVEPTTSVSLEASQDTLSTVVPNKDVVFNVVLNTKNVENRLFENPTLTLTFPSEITKAEVTDAQILYDEELKPAEAVINGNVLTLKLSGKQTKYSESALTSGTLVRVTTNLTLDDLAPSSTEKVTLNYTNDADGSMGTVEKEMDVVAPSGFVTANTITADNGEETTAVESKTENVEISDHSTKAQELTVEGTIVNNLGETAKGVTVVGVIPTEGNKTLLGEDLGSNLSTNLSSTITTEGLENAKVYYSDDKDAKIDSDSWSEQATENSKAYKITSDSEMPEKTKAKFSYKVTVPANVDYEKNANQTYGVYYNNDSDEGTKQNLVQATAVGASTQSIPVIQMGVSAADTNEGYAISEGSTVKVGEEVTYRVKVTNTGAETAKNVKVTMTLPDGIQFYDYKFYEGQIESHNEAIYELSNDTSRTKTIDSLEANHSTYVEFTTKVVKTIKVEDGEVKQGNLGEKLVSVKLTADNISNESNATYTVTVVDGTIATKLISTKADKELSSGDTVDTSFDIANYSNSEIKNIVTTIKIPDGFDYVDKEDVKKQYQEITGKETKFDTLEYDSSYDSKKRTLTIKIDSLGVNGGKKAAIRLKVNDKASKNMKLQAKTTADGIDEISSNTINFNGVAGTSGITTKHTTSLGSNTPKDQDTFSIYIDIANNSGKNQTIFINDNIPDGLAVSSYKITADGKEVANGTSNYISEVFDLQDGKSARLTIVVKPQTLTKDLTQSFEMVPSIGTADGYEVKVDPLTINVNGTGEATVDDSTFTIAGVVFEDANNNGKVDDGENKFKDITVMLFDPSTSDIKKDGSGNEYKTTTNDNGEYRFTDLPRGNYIVVAQYDNKTYGVGIYKAHGIDEAENNDFVEASLNNEEVAASDTIRLSQNEYNINLGLVSKNTFDLALSKVVTKITVANSKDGTKVYNYDNEKTAKVELASKNVQYDTVLIEYKITVTNEGKVEGYATSIVDYIPAGLTFNSDLNSDWYVKDKNAYNQSLANTLLKPGESKDLTLVLQRHMTGEDTGTYNNVAEIASSYNELSIKDINSTAGNKQDGENDQSNAVAVILMSTGREVLQVTGITIGLLALIGLAVYEIKKHVITKVI